MTDDESTIGNLFASMAGQEIKGGCTQCDATQEMTEVAPGVWSLEVAHEHDCKFYRAVVGRRRMN